MDKENRSAFRISPRLVLGLFALVAGALLLFDNLGLIAAWDYLRFWPVALVVVGLIKLVQPYGSRVGGVLFLVAGLWLLADELGYAEFDFHYVWPVLLLVIGLHLVSRELSRRVGRQRAPDTASDIDAFAIMGGVKRASASQHFRGGSCTAVMGGCELDLRQAVIGEGSEAVIDTFAMWGGVEILVPESWSVELKGIPIMGSFDDYTRHPVGGGQRLIVKGMAIMGGVEVKNQRRGES